MGKLMRAWLVAMLTVVMIGGAVCSAEQSGKPVSGNGNGELLYATIEFQNLSFSCSGPMNGQLLNGTFYFISPNGVNSAGAVTNGYGALNNWVLVPSHTFTLQKFVASDGTIYPLNGESFTCFEPGTYVFTGSLTPSQDKNAPEGTWELVLVQ